MTTIRRMSMAVVLCAWLIVLHAAGGDVEVAADAPAAASQPSTRPTPVVAVTFSPDGLALFVAHHDAVVVHSPADGSVRRTLKPDVRRVAAVAISPDGTRLAVGGGEAGAGGEVLLFDARGDYALLSRVGGFGDLVTSVAFAPDGSRLAAASADRTARLYAVRGGRDGTRLETIATLSGHGGPVLAVAFSPDGKSVITAGGDRSVKVWDAAAGTLLRTLNHHAAAVFTLAVRPPPAPAAGDPAGAAGRFTCASGADDRTVRVWQPDIGRMVRIVRGHGGRVLALAYSPDGSSLASAGEEGVVRLMDADGDAVLRSWPASDEWVYALAFAPDGRRVATGDWSGLVRMWDVTGRDVRPAW